MTNRILVEDKAQKSIILFLLKEYHFYNKKLSAILNLPRLQIIPFGKSNLLREFKIAPDNTAGIIDGDKDLLQDNYFTTEFNQISGNKYYKIFGEISGINKKLFVFEKGPEYFLKIAAEMAEISIEKEFRLSDSSLKSIKSYFNFTNVIYKKDKNQLQLFKAIAAKSPEPFNQLRKDLEKHALNVQ
jgi:hypothetical protein